MWKHWFLYSYPLLLLPCANLAAFASFIEPHILVQHQVSVRVENLNHVSTTSWRLSSQLSAISRRVALTNVVASSFVGSVTHPAMASLPIIDNAVPLTAQVPIKTRATSWPLGKVAFSLLPLAGSYSRRATVQETIIDDGKNGIWTFDQLQGVVNVNVPVRMTVVKLSADAGGGLWIHNPLAPTPQLIQLIRTLERQHGPVRHIVLGTVALEHKATLGPFAQYFVSRGVTVWVQRGQWSFPLQLPIEFLGVVQTNDKLRILPSSDYLHGKKTLEEEIDSIKEKRYQYWAKKQPIPEWTIDIDYESLGPLNFKSVGSFAETAFFHKLTKTLIVTDCVCSVTKTPPKIIQEDPRALLYHARDTINDIVIDTTATREKGWRRMVQFGLVFFPSQIDVVPFSRAIRESLEIDPSMKVLGVGGVPGSLYPWTWHDNDADLSNFNAISQSGKLFCPPILTKLILDRDPQQTLEWVERITQRFPFTHIIPGHLNNYVKARPMEFSKAFDPLRSNPNESGVVFPQRALAEDLALLQEASDLLTKFGIVGESKVCDLEPARKAGRFAAFAATFNNK